MGGGGYNFMGPKWERPPRKDSRSKVSLWSLLFTQNLRIGRKVVHFVLLF